MTYSGRDVLRARERIGDLIQQTPALTSSTLDRMIDASVVFKCENFQKTGSFKFRGACNAVASLTPEERLRGVLTHSSGNYAQALALAAQLHNIPAYVVMPETAPEVKVQATVGYGAQITLCPPSHQGRHDTAERLRKETGAVFLDSHDDPRVFTGQGTACLELIEKVGELDLILAPVGGGGLISGTLLAAKHLIPHVRVIGCEPAGADDAARGLARGERIIDFTPHTIADGLHTPLGANTFEIIREQIDHLVVVPEDEILQAMRFIWERMKIVIEPSSAVAVAPLLSGAVEAKGQRVGVILSGGNVNLTAFFQSLNASR